MNISWIRTIYVAKTTGFTLLRVMKTSSPVDSYIALLSIESSSAFHTAACTNAAELEEAVENRTIITDIELRLLPLEVIHILGANLLKEVDVLVCVELGHLESRRRFRSLDNR